MSLRLAGLRSIAAAAAVLHGCGGGGSPEPGAFGGPRSEDTLAAVAARFRRDGVLLGADALDESFGQNGLRIAAALAAPEDLPRFLAASQPVLACPGELPAVIYVSPLFRSLLVTRWSTRTGLRLASVQALPPAGTADPYWLDALPDSPSATALLEARYGNAAGRAREDALCALTRERAPDPAALIADDERDPDLDRVTDPSEPVGELQRALRAFLTRGDSRPFETLGFGASLDTLAPLPTAEPAVFPVPVSAHAAGPIALVLYADLSIPGRYLLLGRIGGDAAGRRVDPTGRVELIALPLER